MVQLHGTNRLPRVFHLGVSQSLGVRESGCPLNARIWMSFDSWRPGVVTFRD